MLLLRFQKCKWSAITVVILSISLMMSIKLCTITVNHLKETEKCPFCFGVTACHFIENSELTINYKGVNAMFSKFFEIKNVYYGKLRKMDVVVKKLAHNSILKVFDELINVELKEKSIDFQILIEKEISTDLNDVVSKLRLCPTVRNVNLLLGKLLLEQEFSFQYLWTLTKINPEPLVLQVLQYFVLFMRYFFFYRINFNISSKFKCHCKSPRKMLCTRPSKNVRIEMSESGKKQNWGTFKIVVLGFVCFPDPDISKPFYSQARCEPICRPVQTILPPTPTLLSQ